MNDWIEEKASQIKKRQAREIGERQSSTHEAHFLHAKGVDVLLQLEAVVRADVEKWNAQFPNDATQRIESVGKLPPNGFTIHRIGYPTATLRAVYDPASMSIQFAATKVRAIGEEEFDIEGLFHLKLSEQGNVYLTDQAGDVFSLEDASRHLLEEVLDT